MTYFFLPGDFRRLCRQIAELEDKIRRIGHEMGEACREGAETFHDNFAHEEGERQQKMWTRRHRDLVRIRDHARVVEPGPDADRVALGRVVTVVDLDTGEQLTFRVGSYICGNGDGVRAVSYEAPLARLLIGAEEGEERTGRLGGRRRTFEVVAVG